MSKTRALAAAAALVLAPAAFVPVAGAPAHAGSDAVPSTYARLTPEEAAAFAKQVERQLASEGVRVGIVFRTGFPRSSLPKGIDYTHGAFWVYRNITLESGETVQGYAVYNLYNGDGQTLPRDQSYLKQDWPLDFVRGTAVDDVGVIVPTPEMQRRIIEIIDSPLYEKLHNPSYSLVANPGSTKHQNCNAFMLSVIAAAAWETEDLSQIASNLKAWFTPQKIEVNLLTRVFGPMADSRLKTDDQEGGIATATFSSMAEFMDKYQLASNSYIILRKPLEPEGEAGEGAQEVATAPAAGGTP